MDFPNYKYAKAITIDLETKDPNLLKLGPGWCRGDGYMVGFALSADGQPANYYPTRHAVGTNLDESSVLRWLQDLLDTAGITWSGHNTPYDFGWLIASGARLPRSIRIEDTLIGGALLDEDLDHYSLSALGKLWLNEDKEELGIRAYADEHAFDPKADLWRMPPEVVGPYACQDVDLTRRLLQHELRRLSEEHLEEPWALESRCIPISIEMRRRGIRLDLNALDHAKARFRIDGEATFKEIEGRWGVKVSPWKQGTVAELCDKFGLRYPGGAKPSFTAPWLKFQAAQPTEAGRAMGLVLKARQLSKAGSTFIDGWIKHLVGDRIHPEWHQTRSDEGGTISFRYSCSNPNLQQVPHRNPTIANILRPLFLPHEGDEFLISDDYNQQEPRLLVDYAAKEGVPGGAEALAMYQQAGSDFHDIATEIIAEIKRPIAAKGSTEMEAYEAERGVYKQVNLGIIYGMGKDRLIAATGKEEDDAIATLVRHGEKLPFMRKMANVAMVAADRRGVIRTQGGYLRRFNLWEPRGYSKKKVPALRKEEALAAYGVLLRRAYTYTGLNALIQTSAAAQMKKGMVAVWDEGITPVLQMHDELLSSGDEKQGVTIAQCMSQAIDMAVPSVVDIEVGPNWGNMRRI